MFGHILLRKPVKYETESIIRVYINKVKKIGHSTYFFSLPLLKSRCNFLIICHFQHVIYHVWKFVRSSYIDEILVVDRWIDTDRVTASRALVMGFRVECRTLKVVFCLVFIVKVSQSLLMILLFVLYVNSIVFAV